MKKLVLIAAVAALSACNERTEVAPAATDSASAMAEATPADSGVGTYTVKMADGTTGTTVINADGTYVDTDKDGKQMKGTFVRRDGNDCFDPEGDEAEMCWTVGPRAADGSFIATAPDGKTTVTVTPAAATATATATVAAPAPTAT